MTLDRSRYKTQSSEEAAAEEKSAQAIVHKGEKKDKDGAQNNWLNIDEGANIIRFFPAHVNAKSSKFLYALVVSWLQCEVWVQKEDTTKQAWNPKDEDITSGKVIRGRKKKKVFNSKKHLEWPEEVRPMDLVEAYLEFVTKLYGPGGEEEMDSEEFEKKVNHLFHWKTGVKPKNTWIAFIKREKSDGSIEQGFIELPNGVKVQLNKLATREQAGKPIVKDIYSHPDSGIPVQVLYNPKEKNPKDKYTVAVLTERLGEDFQKLSDAELIEFEKEKSLEERYVNAFKRSDFEMQYEALEHLDKHHKIGAFQHDKWIEIMEEIASHIPDEEEEEAEEENTSTEAAKSEPKEEVKEQAPTTNPFEGYSKDILVGFIDKFKVDLKVRPSHSAARVAGDLFDELVDGGFQAQIPQMIRQYEGELENSSSDTPEESFEEDNSEESKSKLDKFKAKLNK